MKKDTGDPSLALGMTLWFCGHGERSGYSDILIPQFLFFNRIATSFPL
jgi:hypothetical protein